MLAATPSGQKPGLEHCSPDGTSDDATDEPQGLEWVLKRNCSMSPKQLLGFYLSLCGVSLGIATVFWVHGATLVMPFAWIEVLGLGVAMWLYARHALDRERIVVLPGRVLVEQVIGGRSERREFDTRGLRVEFGTAGHALVELNGRDGSVSVGRHVRSERRAELARELRLAVRDIDHAGR